MFRSLQFILLLLLLLPACDRSLRATDYDQSCEVDDDCFAVEEGDVCYRCGAQTAAINVQEADRFNIDRNDKAGGCVLTSGDSDCFCENESVVACREGQCELAQSNCADVIEPPTFVLTSPRFSDPLPPNVQFRGQLEPSTDDSEVVDVKIVGLTEDRPLTVTAGHCATRNGCELVMDPGGLPAGASLELVFTFNDVEERHAFSVSDELDTTAPFVPPLLSPTTEVSADRDEAGNPVFQMDIGLSRPEALSDEGIAGAALERSLDGGPPLLVERYETTARGGVVVDTIFEREEAERACYRYLAWDPSGNETFSEPLCLDVAINDGNKPKTGCGAGPAGGAVALSLLVLLGRLDGIRRGRRVKKTCACVETSG